jgi:outer membrane translocation and assembly module TamA
MKTLKSVTVALALFATCSFAKANDVPPANLTKTHAINTYIDAMTHGKLNDLSQVIDPSATFTIQRGDDVLSFTKNQIIDDLKSQANIDQECTTTNQVVDEGTNKIVVKVDMNFAQFTRSNYVTIVNTGKGWKITNVNSVFK